MAAPESEYDVRGELNNPFSNLNKEEKLKKLEQAKRLKEAEKRAKEEAIRAEKEAKKEAARLLKEAELADKIKKRTADNERQAQEEARRKADEKALAEQRKQEEESRKKAEKEAVERQKKEEERARKLKKEEEEAERKRKVAEEKAAVKERRARELKEEEEKAAQRAQEIAAARALQKKIDEGKKKGKIPENFIPVVWTSSEMRREIEDILEKPYWEPAPDPTPRKFERRAPDLSNPIKSTFRSPDTWLEEQWAKQTSVPWTTQTWRTVAEPQPVDFAALAAAASPDEKAKAQSLVERYREIVRSVPPQPASIVKSGEKPEDVALKLAPQAKSQAAAMWAAIEKGEVAAPVEYDGFVLESFGKIVMKRVSGEPSAPVSHAVVELMAEMSKLKEEIYGSRKAVEPSSDVVAVQRVTSEPEPEPEPEPVRAPSIPELKAVSEPASQQSQPQSEPAKVASLSVVSLMSTFQPALAPSQSSAPQSVDVKTQPEETHAQPTAEQESDAMLAAKNKYGPKPTPAKTAYGPKPTVAAAVAPAEAAPPQSPYGSKAKTADPVSTTQPQSAYGSKAKVAEVAPTPADAKYGSKQSVAPPTTTPGSAYGPKPAPAAAATASASASPYGSKKDASPAQRRESVYGRPSLSSVVETPGTPTPTPTLAPASTPTVVEENEYGSKIANAAAAQAAMRPTVIASENEYAYSVAPPKSSAAAAAAAAAKAAPAIAKAAPAAPAAEAAPEAPRPSLVQSLSAEQIIAMVNAMTIQQQQQAYMMLKTAASKGTQLSPQQAGLMNFLEQKFMQMAAAARAAAGSGQSTSTYATAAAAQPAAQPAAAAAAAAPQQKKGLYFMLKKQTFQFGIPGREIITLRHFDRFETDKNKVTEKVLMVICNDVTFVCRQGDSPGQYELFEKPTQRDAASAMAGPQPNSFVLTLGTAEKYTLLAGSSEERQHWVQTINARQNFVPTEKLGEYAAAKQAAAPKS